MLDAKSRCCGRKPMVYKTGRYTSGGPQRYCPRCDRAYDIDDDDQIPNWAWRKLADGSFERQTSGKGAR